MALLTLALLTALAGAPTAKAPPEPSTVAARIERARQALDNLEYENAALDLTLAASDPRATEAERVEANLLAGLAQRVLGHDTDARLHFLYVLRRAPHTTLPDDVGPKIQAFFELVREEVRGEALTTAPARTEEPVAPLVPASTTTDLPVAPVLVGSGVMVAVIGAGLLMVGAQPWFAHEGARAALDSAAATGEPAVDAAEAQAAARADWEDFGAAMVGGGGVGIALGLIVSGIGGAVWAMEGT